jgi:hypothetical protein
MRYMTHVMFWLDWYRIPLVLLMANGRGTIWTCAYKWEEKYFCTSRLHNTCTTQRHMVEFHVSETYYMSRTPCVLFCVCIVQPCCAPITTLNEIPHLTKSETDEKNKEFVKIYEAKKYLTLNFISSLFWSIHYQPYLF